MVISYKGFSTSGFHEIVTKCGKSVAKSGKPSLNWFGFGLDLVWITQKTDHRKRNKSLQRKDLFEFVRDGARTRDLRRDRPAR